MARRPDGLIGVHRLAPDRAAYVLHSVTPGGLTAQPPRSPGPVISWYADARLTPPGPTRPRVSWADLSSPLLGRPCPWDSWADLSLGLLG